jgi:hypothetical protein
MEPKKLTTSTDYLLPDGLNSLHEQSRYWMETVEFWKDEIRFLGSLLDKEQFALPKNEILSELLQNLENGNGMLLDYLTEEIREHEKVLAKIEQGEPGMADAEYRDAHQKLAGKLNRFETDFQNLKKLVFELAK